MEKKMRITDIIKNRRTIRRFKQEPIEKALLIEMIDHARLAPMGGNIQCLKYQIIDEKSRVDKVFYHVKWAAYLGDEGAPKENKRPVAYIAVLADIGIKKSGHEVIAGAAIQNILITATAYGIGTCWMGAINRSKISELLYLEEALELKYIIALGYPDEAPVMEAYHGDFKYYKDELDTLHVPKLSLEEVIVG